jgi:integrase
LPDLGGLRLNDVNGDDLQGLIDRLVGSGLSGSKVRNVIVPVQALYRRNRRQVDFDPTNDLDLPDEAPRRERVASPVEAAKLLDALPDEEQALWATAFFGGLRRGELRGLRVRDVDCRITVARGWDEKEGPIAPKSLAGKRDVPLPETLRVYVERHIAQTGRAGDDLLFGRTASDPFTPTHIRDVANAAWLSTHSDDCALRSGGDCDCDEGLTRIGLHECRHSFSTYLDAAGISETRADRYMGHSNASVQARYRHQLEGQLADDAARLNAYLVGAISGKVVPITGAQTGAQAAQTA